MHNCQLSFGMDLTRILLIIYLTILTVSIPNGAWRSPAYSAAVEAQYGQHPDRD